MFHERIALGLPSLAGYDLHGALAKATELGFQSIMTLPGGPRTEHSLGPFPTLDFYDASEETRQETRKALACFKRISLHQAWDDRWETWIDCAGYVGSEFVTVHSGRRQEHQDSGAFIRERSRQLRCIGDYAQQQGIRIGVENEGGACEDYLGLIRSLAHQAVGATIDLGHCASFEHVAAGGSPDERVARINETICGLIETLGDRVFALHVHDVRESDWRDHRTPSTGVIDFPGVFDALAGIAFSGMLDIELEEPERESAAKRTGEYLSGLI